MVYPGRPAPGHGPDFRDAVLELDGSPLRGDVEIHRRPGDWTAHGHHRDRAYESVVLHVVGSSAGPPPKATAHLPMLELGPPEPGVQGPGPFAAAGPPPLAALARAGPDELLAALRRAGLERFEARVEEASAAIARHGVEQTLYAGLLEVLGYAENRAPFRALSQVLPVTLLRSVITAYPSEAWTRVLGELLRSAAGWEPPSEPWAHLVGLTPMAPGDWRTAGVRPLNHPRRRLEGALLLLRRHLGPGLAPSLAAVLAGGHTSLTQALTVSERGEGGPPRAAPVGRGRAAEMSVNVVLPVLTAWAEERATRRYRSGAAGSTSTIPRSQRTVSPVRRDGCWAAGSWGPQRSAQAPIGSGPARNRGSSISTARPRPRGRAWTPVAAPTPGRGFDLAQWPGYPRAQARRPWGAPKGGRVGPSSGAERALPWLPDEQFELALDAQRGALTHPGEGR